MDNLNIMKPITILPPDFYIDESTGYLYQKAAAGKEPIRLCNYVPAVLDYWTETDGSGTKMDWVIFCLNINKVVSDIKFTVRCNAIKMLDFSSNAKCMDFASKKLVMRQIDLIIRFTCNKLNGRLMHSYNKMGWSLFDNQCVYLAGKTMVSQEGLIAPEKYSVSDDLKNISLKIDESLSEIQALKSGIELMRIHQVAAPVLIANTFLSLSRSLLAEIEIVPDFSVFLEGESGFGKSELTHLLCNIYGRGAVKKLGKSDLLSSLQSMLIQINQYRDSVFIIDDMHEEATRSLSNSLSERLYQIIRLVGNDSGAEKMCGNHCSSLLPLASVVVTSEIPLTVKSALTRCIWVKMKKKIDFDLLEKAKQNPLAFSTCVYYYLRWYAGNRAEIEQALPELFQSRRRFFSEKCTSEKKLANDYAVLLVGMHLFLKYAESLGYDQYEKSMSEFVKTLLRLLETQDTEVEKLRKKENPSVDLAKDIVELYRLGKFNLVERGQSHPAIDDGFINGDMVCLYSPRLRDILNTMHPNCNITPHKIGKQLRAAGLVDIDETLRSQKKVGHIYMYHIYHDMLMEYQ
jgi:hypothetical protein